MIKRELYQNFSSAEKIRLGVPKYDIIVFINKDKRAIN